MKTQLLGLILALNSGPFTKSYAQDDNLKNFIDRQIEDAAEAERKREAEHIGEYVSNLLEKYTSSKQDFMSEFENLSAESRVKVVDILAGQAIKYRNFEKLEGKIKSNMDVFYMRVLTDKSAFLSQGKIRVNQLISPVIDVEYYNNPSSLSSGQLGVIKAFSRDLLVEEIKIHTSKTGLNVGNFPWAKVKDNWTNQTLGWVWIGADLRLNEKTDYQTDFTAFMN